MKTDELYPLYVEKVPDVLKMGMLYIAKEWGTAIHLCACGCGYETITPLQPNNADGWILTDNEGKVTLRPSIGNWKGQHPFHAHYYITNNKIEWLDNVNKPR